MDHIHLLSVLFEQAAQTTLGQTINFAKRALRLIHFAPYRISCDPVIQPK